MYAYIYDAFLQDRKYQSALVQIENRLTTLGIHGRQEKITILKNLRETVRDLLKRGAETLVLVGNDETISKVLPELIDSEVVVGFIPLGPHQLISRSLGIPEGLSAAEDLSRRVTKRLDLGMAGTTNFLLQMEFPMPVEIRLENKYSVSSLAPTGRMTVTNLHPQHGRPDDGKLELIVEPAGGGGWSSWKKSAHQTSVFPFKKATVKPVNGAGNAVLDGQTTANLPFEISVASKKIRFIVGRQRQF